MLWTLLKFTLAMIILPISCFFLSKKMVFEGSRRAFVIDRYAPISVKPEGIGRSTQGNLIVRSVPLMSLQAGLSLSFGEV